MPDGDPTPDAPRQGAGGWDVALDWIDFLLMVALSTGATALLGWLGWLGWRPPSALAGAIPAMMIAAPQLRHRLLPRPRRAPVLKRLSLLGVLTVALMMAGMGVSLFGSFGALSRLRAEPERIDERAVRALARAQAHAAVTPTVAPLGAEDATRRGSNAAGTVEELMAEVARGPSEAAIAEREVAVRRQLEAEAAERVQARRAGGPGFALRAGLLAVALIGLGGLLDARRARAA